MKKLVLTPDIQNEEENNTSSKIRLDKLIMNKIHELSKNQEDTLAAFPNMSRAFCQKLIKGGHVMVANDAIIDPSALLSNIKSVITINIPEQPDSTELKPNDINLDIVFEDESIMVINKQKGLVVHPGAGINENTLANGLLARFGNKLPTISGTKRPGIVHRLDKDTSGLMVIAKTENAFFKLTQQFANRSLSRIYYTCVWGVLNPTEGQIIGNIARSRHNRQKMCVAKSQGKSALTKYSLMEVWNNSISLVKCRLGSGRTHQIRVHMHHIQHPVLGDALYGSVPKRYRMCSNEKVIEYLKDNSGQILHAKELSLIHPTTNKKMTFKTELPEVFHTLKNL